MNFKAVLPVCDSRLSHHFDSCGNNEEYLVAVFDLWKSTQDSRVKEAALAVLMAYRDHYPKYLKVINHDSLKMLDAEIEKNFARLIKLRRIALSELAKVA